MTDSTAIQLPSTLKDKVVEMLQEKLGSLIERPQLEAMLHQSIEESLFKPQIIKVHDQYAHGGFITKTTASWAQETIQPMIKEAATKVVKEAVEKWVAENDEVIKTMLEDMFVKNAGETFIRGFASVFQNSMSQFEYNMRNDITNILNQRR